MKIRRASNGPSNATASEWYDNNGKDHESPTHGD